MSAPWTDEELALLKRCKEAGMRYSEIAPLIPNHPFHSVKTKAQRCGWKNKPLKNTGRETICWSCPNACGGCSWSREFKPVEGWKAKYNEDSQSYCVIKCPLYPKQPKQKKRRKYPAVKFNRAKFLKMEARGASLTEIAKAFHVTVQTVKNWRRREREIGAA